jgi:hypothetical protein
MAPAERPAYFILGANFRAPNAKSRRTNMVTKSKLAFVLAIAALGLASPAFAQTSRTPSQDWPAQNHNIRSNSVDNPALTGGGSTGYNQDMRTDY